MSVLIDLGVRSLVAVDCLDDEDDQIGINRHQNVRNTDRAREDSKLLRSVIQLQFTELFQEVLIFLFVKGYSITVYVIWERLRFYEVVIGVVENPLSMILYNSWFLRGTPILH